MSDADLRRMREDLDTIQEAAGLNLPFGWADVWQALALAPSGAALALWAAFAPEEHLVLGLAPLLLLALVASVRHLRGSGRAAARSGREKRFETLSTLGVAAGLAVYLLWARTFGAMRGTPGAGAPCYFLGVMCILMGLSARARRVYFAGAVSLIPFGLIIPLLANQQQVAAAGGLAVLVAGLAAAGLMAWQLRTDGKGS